MSAAMPRIAAVTREDPSGASNEAVRGNGG